MKASQRALLDRILQAISDADIDWCILHGYQDFEVNEKYFDSDIDCVVDSEDLPRRLVNALTRAGLRVVQHLQHEATAHYLVITDGTSSPKPCLIRLDVSSDYRRNGAVFYSGEEIIESRRMYQNLWIPSPAYEFGYYLVKKLAKGVLTEKQEKRLSELYAQDPAGCAVHIHRFLQGSHATLVESSARTEDWRRVHASMDTLRRQLLLYAAVRSPIGALSYRILDSRRRVHRLINPTGLHIAFEGPDSNEKPVISAAVEEALAPAFRRTMVRHLDRGTRADQSQQGGGASEPNGGRPGSLLGAAFRTLESTLDYAVRIRPRLVRSTLVLSGCSSPNVAEDPKGNRYAGPSWLVRFVSRLAPRPDLVFSLDAPQVSIREREHETSLDESPLETVVSEINHVSLEFLAMRTAKRLGTEHRSISTSPLVMTSGIPYRSSIRSESDAVPATDYSVRVPHLG